MKQNSNIELKVETVLGVARPNLERGRLPWSPIAVPDDEKISFPWSIPVPDDDKKNYICSRRW